MILEVSIILKNNHKKIYISFSPVFAGRMKYDLENHFDKLRTTRQVEFGL